MKNELTILNKFQQVIQTQLNQYLPEEFPQITDRNVEIDFPDVDKMPKETMFYLNPNYANYDNLTDNSDSSTFSITVIILCKRDKQENLTTKTYGYFNALYELIRNNISLDGCVDFADIISADFYPAIEGNKNVKGVEVEINTRYTKDF